MKGCRIPRAQEHPACRAGPRHEKVSGNEATEEHKGGYSAVWYGMARHGTAWHGTAWYSAARHSTAQPGSTQHSMAWHFTAQHITGQPSLRQHSLAQESLAWFGMCNVPQHCTAWHCMAQGSMVLCSLALQNTTQQCPAQQSVTRAQPFLLHIYLFPTIWTRSASFTSWPRLKQGTLCQTPSYPGAPATSHSHPAATACPTHGKTNPSHKA